MRQGMLSEIGLFAGRFAPEGWMFCDGQRLPIAEYPGLFKALGRRYGGDEATFGLPAIPDLLDEVRPILCVQGGHFASDPRIILGEIRLIAGDTPVDGWFECQGQPLTTALYTALHSLLEETFGGSPGDHRSRTFALPRLKHPLEGPRYVIAYSGIYPDPSGGPGDAFQGQSLGEIRLWPSARLPFGWAACDGSAVIIRANTALFSILGTAFGGDDHTQAPGARFKLPRIAPPIPNVRHVICVDGTYPRRP